MLVIAVIALLAKQPSASLSAPDPFALQVQGPATLGNPQQIAIVGQSNPNSLQTPLHSTATGAASSANVSLGGVAGKTTYLAGFSVSGLGSTAGGTVNITTSNLLTAQETYVITIPASATQAITTLQVTYNPPIPAVGQGQGITINVPSFGAGNTLSCAQCWGFRE
jgi:hypothetical protein